MKFIVIAAFSILYIVSFPTGQLLLAWIHKEIPEDIHEAVMVVASSAPLIYFVAAIVQWGAIFLLYKFIKKKRLKAANKAT